MSPARNRSLSCRTSCSLRTRKYWRWEATSITCKPTTRRGSRRSKSTTRSCVELQSPNRSRSSKPISSSRSLSCRRPSRHQRRGISSCLRIMRPRSGNTICRSSRCRSCIMSPRRQRSKGSLSRSPRSISFKSVSFKTNSVKWLRSTMQLSNRWYWPTAAWNSPIVKDKACSCASSNMSKTLSSDRRPLKSLSSPIWTLSC